MKSNEKRLIKDTLIFTLGNLGSKIIQFLLVPLYTYSMTTNEFGVSDLLLTTVSVLMPVFSFSVVDGLLRFGLDKNEKREYVFKNSVFIVTIGTILSFAFIPLFMQVSFIKEWTFMFIIILNLRMYQDIFTTYLKVCDKNKQYAISSMVSTFVLCIFNVLFLSKLHLGIAGYLYSYIISSLVTIVYTIFVIRLNKVFREGKINRNDLKKIFIYSFPLIINALSGWIITASDRYMINYFLTENELGLYSIATKMPSFITTFSSIFLQAWTLSAIREHDDNQKNSFYLDIYKKYFFIVLLSATLLTTIIYPFMKIYVSEDYFTAWKYVPLLLSCVIYMSLINYYSGLYIAFKKNINITVTISIGAIANIILNYFLIPVFRVNGAVIATYLSWILVFILRIFDMKKICNFKDKDRRELLFCILNLIQCIIVTNFPIRIAIILSCMILGLILFCYKSYMLSIWIFICNKIKGTKGSPR